VGGLLARAPQMAATARGLSSDFHSGLGTLGLSGMALLFVHAYSLGGGTYTGIEAVSNGLPIMREPRARTAKRTMVYMAVSLAFTATGLLLCYLLWRVEPSEGKTLNAVLVEKMTAHLPLGNVLAIVTLFSEGVLLVVAAQAGFIDGPRVLGNMAVDDWMPRRFAALSERLTTGNGIGLMGAASLGALVYTGGNVGKLVVMYSINVFLTFSLSMFGMMRMTWRRRQELAGWSSQLGLFVVGFVLCATILVITVVEKFREGGWLTLLVTAAVVGLCFLIHRHYASVRVRLAVLYDDLRCADDGRLAARPILNPRLPTAAILVPSYGAVGIHTVLNVFRAFPHHFRNVVFISVGVIDSGGFKGAGCVEELEHETEAMLKKYESLATSLDVPSTHRFAVATESVAAAEELCVRTLAEFPQVTFFGGKVVFAKERWFQRFLHNETAAAIQRRLYWLGATMVILPAKVSEPGPNGA
jgi:hypothetical protein